MSAQVWLVFIITGEYESATRNVMAVFSTQEKAETYTAHMNQELDCAGLHEGGNCSRSHDNQYRWSDEIQKKFGIISCTGATYYVAGPYTIDQEPCD